MLNKINFFQLDNLINNRVPFLFFNMSENLSSWYTSINKLHVENHQILTTLEQIIPILTEKKIPKDQAIVLLCHDGSQSLQIFQNLEKMAYTNVYVIDGGYQQIVTERQLI